MQKLTPCLWLTGNAEEAASLYMSTFKNPVRGGTSYYTKATSQVSGMAAGAVMTIDIQIAGLDVQVLNGGPYFEHTPSVSLFVTCGSIEEFDQIYKKLSPGGKVIMEPGEYPFSPRYGFFSDKFGVHWQVFVEKGAAQKIAPAIIFSGEKEAVGPKAIDFYLSLFKNARKLVDVRYEKDEGAHEGSIKHARLSLDGSELVIMDAGHKQPMPLTGALSLVVNCETQAEVDRFWDAIGKKGQEVQCGWINDEFQVAWQVVPIGMNELFASKDLERVDRAAAAMLTMKKLDIAKIKAAAQ